MKPFLSFLNFIVESVLLENKAWHQFVGQNAKKLLDRAGLTDAYERNKRHTMDPAHGTSEHLTGWISEKLGMQDLNTDEGRWVLKHLHGGGIQRAEDVQATVIPNILRLRQAKTEGKSDASLAKIQGAAALHAHLAKVYPASSESLEHLSPEEYTVHGENEHWTVVQPHTKEAACAVGKGTNWCTASTQEGNMFEHYNKHGPLMVFIPKTPKHKSERYQLHVPDGPDSGPEMIQFMDSTDTPSDVPWHKERPLPEIKDQDFQENIHVLETIPIIKTALNSKVGTPEYEAGVKIVKETFQGNSNNSKNLKLKKMLLSQATHEDDYFNNLFSTTLDHDTLKKNLTDDSPGMPQAMVNYLKKTISGRKFARNLQATDPDFITTLVDHPNDEIKRTGESMWYTPKHLDKLFDRDPHRALQLISHDTFLTSPHEPLFTHGARVGRITSNFIEKLTSHPNLRVVANGLDPALYADSRNRGTHENYTPIMTHTAISNALAGVKRAKDITLLPSQTPEEQTDLAHQRQAANDIIDHLSNHANILSSEHIDAILRYAPERTTMNRYFRSTIDPNEQPRNPRYNEDLARVIRQGSPLGYSGRFDTVTSLFPNAGRIRTPGGYGLPSRHLFDYITPEHITKALSNPFDYPEQVRAVLMHHPKFNPEIHLPAIEQGKQDLLKRFPDATPEDIQDVVSFTKLIGNPHTDTVIKHGMKYGIQQV